MCEQDVGHITVRLIGIGLKDRPSETVDDPDEHRLTGDCRTDISVHNGAYARDAAWWKHEHPAEPDVVVGLNIEAYTCSWRKSLLQILEQRRPAILSFR